MRKNGKMKRWSRIKKFQKEHKLDDKQKKLFDESKAILPPDSD